MTHVLCSAVNLVGVVFVNSPYLSFRNVIIRSKNMGNIVGL